MAKEGVSDALPNPKSGGARVAVKSAGLTDVAVGGYKQRRCFQTITIMSNLTLYTTTAGE
jgi:hypothetical protein